MINTGEEAISFFAKYGNSTPIKYIYCIRNTECPETEFRPYDLSVIKLNKNSKEIHLTEYYTVSSRGIVHVCTPEKSK